MRRKGRLPGVKGRRVFAGALVVILMAGAVPFPAAAGAATRALGAGVGTEVIGGRTWTTDIRVTNSPYNDTAPQAYVGANDSVHFLWRKLVDTNESYYYAQFDPLGNALQNETYITNHTVPSRGPQYEMGPAIGIDSASGIHVVYTTDPDYLNIHYEKFDTSGLLLVPEKNIGSTDAYISEQAALSVGRDDTVHVASEDYKFQCEDILYAKLANDGSEIWSQRVVSSDVASHAEFDLVKASRFSGNVLFTFGSTTGTWLGRFNSYGVKDLPSIKIRSQADLKIADVAETPNGDVHLVWADAGFVHYSRVNATGIKVVDDALLTANATAGGFPHVEAASDGSVMVVWEDNRSGDWQVMYAVIAAGGSVSGADQVQLTNSPVRAYQPWVAVDSNDDFVVAWVDERDGNPEVYYKRMFGCPVELYGDPISLSWGGFLHPNDTQVLPLHLKNKGILPDSYLLELQFTAGAIAQGWNVSINQTHVDDLAGGAVADLGLTLHAPSDAKQGENISIEVNATSTRSPACFDDIRLTAYVRVTRSLLLNTGTSVRIADNGETVCFAMVATNTGDVRENEIDILPGANYAPTGWVVTVDKTTLALDPKEVGYFTACVTVPTDVSLAPANMLGHIGITIRSAADGTVTAAKEVLVQVTAWFFITMKSDAEAKSAAPGDRTAFVITVANVGNLGGQAQIDVQAQAPSKPGWSATLSTETVYLRGGENTTVHLSVWVPWNAIAGANLTTVVSAFGVKYGTTGQTEVTVFVAPVCGFVATYTTLRQADRAGPATFNIAASNRGNTEQTVALEPQNLPPHWIAVFRSGGLSISNLTLAPFSNTTFTAEFQSGFDTLAGNYAPSILFSPSACELFELTLPTRVAPFVSFDLEAPTPVASAPAGGTASYDLQVHNRGNAPVSLLLSAGGLPLGYSARFVPLASDNTTEFPESLAGPLALDAFAGAAVRLYVTLPNVTADRGLIFTVGADAATGEASLASLTLDIPWPDAAVTGARFTSASPRAGASAVVVATVQNLGQAGTPAATVEFYLDGAVVAVQDLGPLGPGAGAQITFGWRAVAGSHELRFVVVLAEGASEEDLANNEFAFHADVAGVPQPASPVDASLLATALILAVGAAALFLIMRAPPRRRPPAPPRPPGEPFAKTGK